MLSWWIVLGALMVISLLVIGILIHRAPVMEEEEEEDPGFNLRFFPSAELNNLREEWLAYMAEQPALTYMPFTRWYLEVYKGKEADRG